MKLHLASIFCAIYCAFIFPTTASAQYDEDRLVAKVSDFGVISFEQKNSLKSRMFSTSSVYFAHSRNATQTESISEGALRFGMEKHSPLFKNLNYFVGSDIAGGFDLTAPSSGENVAFTLYGAWGIEAGIYVNLGKRFALGFQSAMWLKYNLPLTETSQDQMFDSRMSGDIDWITFNFIYKVPKKDKAKI